MKYVNQETAVNDENIEVRENAGTPGISDPGAVLAGFVRKAGHSVIPIPGASAFAALASVAGAGGKRGAAHPGGG